MTPNHPVDPWRSVLETALEKELGAPARILEMVRKPVVTSPSHRLEEIRLLLQDGRGIELFAKDIGPGGMSPAATAVKPPDLLDPWRETLIYLDPLRSAELGTARCYGAWRETGPNRIWLLLDKVPGSELFQSGEMGVWKSACAWLARLHARFSAARPDFPSKLRLLRLDSNYLRSRMAAASEVVLADPSLQPARKTSFLKIRDRYADWIDFSLDSAPTLGSRTSGASWPPPISRKPNAWGWRCLPISGRRSKWSRPMFS